MLPLSRNIKEAKNTARQREEDKRRVSQPKTTILYTGIMMLKQKNYPTYNVCVKLMRKMGNVIEKRQ